MEINNSDIERIGRIMAARFAQFTPEESDIEYVAVCVVLNNLSQTEDCTPLVKIFDDSLNSC